MRFLLLICVYIVISGCSVFHTSRVNLGQGQSDGHHLLMIKVSASERVVIADANTGRVCAEPPPETQTTQDINTSLSILAKKAADIDSTASEGKKAELQAAFLNAYSQGVQQLYKRSHSNQLFRDAAYYLCQAHANGVFSDPFVRAALIKISDIIRKIDANTNFAILDEDFKQLYNIFPKIGTSLYQGQVQITTAKQLDESKEEFKSLPKISTDSNTLKDAAVIRENLLKLKQVLSDYGTESEDSAYLVAYVNLTNQAFASLGTEIKGFYDATLTTEQGKSAGMKDALNTLKPSIDAVETKLADVQKGIAIDSAMGKAVTDIKTKLGDSPDIIDKTIKSSGEAIQALETNLKAKLGGTQVVIDQAIKSNGEAIQKVQESVDKIKVPAP